MQNRITTLDLVPFFKNSIGINSRLDSMFDRVNHANNGNYPPYNIIEVSEDKYKIEVAVAGFAESEVSVMVEHGQLIIEGSKIVDETAVFLHNGISARDFLRTFTLADYVEVQSAEVQNGILSVCLERIVPEAMKPKEIEVKHIK